MADENYGLDPAAIYRTKEGKRIWGLEKSALHEAIKNGKIPPPEPVYEGAQATGWPGQIIIEHRRKTFGKKEIV